jgi:hypothetical protein
VADGVRFLEVLIPILGIALAIALAVFIGAAAFEVLRPVGRWVEVRALPIVARRARIHHGVPPEAPPWACGYCSSMNLPTASTCYHCGVPRPPAARELHEAATDPGIFHRPRPRNEFDPSRYRGPGASPPRGTPAP